VIETIENLTRSPGMARPASGGGPCRGSTPGFSEAPNDHFARARKMVYLGSSANRGIIPEQLPPAEDVKKIERRRASEQKKLSKKSGRLDAE